MGSLCQGIMIFTIQAEEPPRPMNPAGTEALLSQRRRDEPDPV